MFVQIGSTILAFCLLIPTPQGGGGGGGAGGAGGAGSGGAQGGAQGGAGGAQGTGGAQGGAGGATGQAGSQNGVKPGSQGGVGGQGATQGGQTGAQGGVKPGSQGGVGGQGATQGGQTGAQGGVKPGSQGGVGGQGGTNTGGSNNGLQGGNTSGGNRGLQGGNTSGNNTGLQGGNTSGGNTGLQGGNTSGNNTGLQSGNTSGNNTGLQGGVNNGVNGLTPGLNRSSTNAGFSLQRSDRLFGMGIQDRGQAQLGRVDDVMINPNGQINYAILSGAGSDAHAQGRLHVVPWSSVNFNSQNAGGAQDPNGLNGGSSVGAGSGTGAGTNTGTSGGAGATGSAGVAPQTRADLGSMTVDRNRFMNGPSFDRSDWTQLTRNRDLFNQADTYYGGAGSPNGSASGGVQNEGLNGRATDATAAQSNAFRASQLRNQAVVDAQGNTIGSINQFAFDPSGGRLAYVSVALTNPSANGGRRTIAVPWEAIKVARTADKQTFTLNAPVERLQAAPEFRAGEDAWKQMSDPNWVNDMYGYYNVRPYWNRASGDNADGSSSRTNPNGGTSGKEPR